MKSSQQDIPESKSYDWKEGLLLDIISAQDTVGMGKQQACCWRCLCAVWMLPKGRECKLSGYQSTETYRWKEGCRRQHAVCSFMRNSQKRVYLVMKKQHEREQSGLIRDHKQFWDLTKPKTYLGEYEWGRYATSLQYNRNLALRQMGRQCMLQSTRTGENRRQNQTHKRKW